MGTIQEYFILFIIYSFLGWCMETALVSYLSKKFVNRGFLIGPVCPIYGFGAIAIDLILGRFIIDPAILFITTVFMCGTLEYITSWLMEVIFKARWWDYSDKKINLNGRICLSNLIAFGVLGLLVVYILNPFLLEGLNNFSVKSINILAIILFSIFLIDAIISFVVIFGFRKVTEEVNKEEKADNTEQITKMVRDLFSKKSYFHRRFINAYPRLMAIKIKTKIKEITTKIGEVTNDAKDAVVEKTGEIKNSIERGTNQVKSKIEYGTSQVKSKIEKGTNHVKTKIEERKKDRK